MKFEYKSVPFSAVLKVQKNHSEVANMYDAIINQEAVRGWELVLIDTISSFKPGGCFAGKDEQTSIKIAVFKRAVE
jgi:hypothetical protein